MILKAKKFSTIVLFLFTIFLLPFSNLVIAEEESSQGISNEIQQLRQDLKTLEKAVYKTSDITPLKKSSSNKLNEDILTRHLLKLNEIESQFQDLTNKFEEINFKMDKLTKRVSKIQSDTQLRFDDLETVTGNTETSKNKKLKKTTTKLPGSAKPNDFGANPGYSTTNLPKEQKINSIETPATIISERPEEREDLLPNKPPKDQYDFAVSFMKIGDYETAEFALKEFIEKNKDHDLAGNAQYWYGETFRVRQLYQDAATAYLDGYQKYPDSKKAPVNLLKLGVMLVQIGEKTQGCSMILGVKDQYPKANQSVIQKAEYEKKKFNCEKKS